MIVVRITKKRGLLSYLKNKTRHKIDDQPNTKNLKKQWDKKLKTSFLISLW